MLLLSLLTGLAGAQTLDLTGTCPGSFDITVSGLTPGGSFALLSSSDSGLATLPAGPCAGTATGLSSSGLTLRATLTVDANGRGQLTPTLPAGACGLVLQAVDLSTCTVSNYDWLPLPVVASTISDVQLGVHAPFDVVSVDGVVTATHDDGLWVQEAGPSAQHGGVYVYLGAGWDTAWGQLQPGDELTVQGEVREFFDLTEINVVDSPSGEVVWNASGAVPAPAQVLLSDLVNNAEAWEGVLVSVTGAQVASLPDAFGVWQITDGTVAIDVDDDIHQLGQQPPVGTTLQLVQGPLHYAYGTFRILPRDGSDVR